MRRTGGQGRATGSRTGCLRRALLSLGLAFAVAAPLGALDAPPAWAKDGGSSGGGHGGSDGGGGGGSSGGGDHDSGDHDSGDHDSGGHDSGGHGGSSSSRGGGDDSGGDRDRSDRSGRSDKSRSKDRGRDRDEMEVRYSDGWSESVKGGRYVLRDAGQRVVVNRAARQSDRKRLQDLGR